MVLWKSDSVSKCSLFSVILYFRSKTHFNSNSNIVTRRKKKNQLSGLRHLALVILPSPVAPVGNISFYKMTQWSNSNDPISSILALPGTGSVFLRDFRSTATVTRMSFTSSSTVCQVKLFLSSFSWGYNKNTLLKATEGWRGLFCLTVLGCSPS